MGRRRNPTPVEELLETSELRSATMSRNVASCCDVFSEGSFWALISFISTNCTVVKCAVINYIRQQNINELDINSASSRKNLNLLSLFEIQHLSIPTMTFGNLSSASAHDL